MSLVEEGGFTRLYAGAAISGLVTAPVGRFADTLASEAAVQRAPPPGLGRQFWSRGLLHSRQREDQSGTCLGHVPRACAL